MFTIGKLVDSLSDHIKEAQEDKSCHVTDALEDTLRYLDDNLGLTEGQKNSALIDLLGKIIYPYSKCGIFVGDADILLDPSKEGRLYQIDKLTWQVLRKRAKYLLNYEDDELNAETITHLEHIADGIPPFDIKVVPYSVEE